MSDNNPFYRKVESGDKVDYGTPRHSGRYPWGSGGDAYSNSLSFSALVKSMYDGGLSEKEVAQGMGMSIADLRARKTVAKEVIVREQTNRAVKLREKGVSIDAIAKDLDMAAPTVRLRLKNSENMKQSSLTKTADVLREAVDTHKIVDIGKGTELHVDAGLKMGISPEKLRAATSILRDEGYEVYNIQQPQVGSKNFTNQLVITPPGTTFGQASKMRGEVHTIGVWSEDDGLTYSKTHFPISVNSRRLAVRFKEDGGTDSDGLIEIRPGVKDLDMGKNTYAQVRIAVDGTHYIKGMAVLNPDLPAGTDLRFSTNKSKTVGKKGALKPLETDKDGNVDQDNPFGSSIKRQIFDIDPKTGAQKLKSALNLVNEEGDWDTWRNSLPSQMLAKQPHSLIKSQLATTRDQIRTRLDEIDTITNPVVKKKAFEDFADQVDSDAVDLRAAQMPRQKTRVIIPMPKMTKGEIYAPDFETGERVALIRYPHGGKFEIPEVVVNNNNRTAKKLLGNAKDAIGLHPSVAERLSGADFDGDTVVVIPNRSGKIKGIRSLGSQAKVYEDALNNYEPKRLYGGFVQTGTDSKGRPVGNYPIMKNTGKEMGVITNLITDMSVQGAKPEHIVRAVKHSMVVIDAEKHKLDYKQSENDNNIKQLKELYQSKPGTTRKGATTLLSQATAKVTIPQEALRAAKDGGAIDPKTGAKVYVPTGKTNNKYDPKTKTYDPNVKVPITEKKRRLELTDDAFNLVRDPSDPVERLYAEHANQMKALANSARLRSSRIPNPTINKQAKVVYKDEVDKLLGDLKNVVRQKPLDRRAQTLANNIVRAKRKDDPLLREDADRRKKVEKNALATARARLGLEKPLIDVSPRQWDAIQSGAVSPSKLRDILKNADPKQIDDYALPKGNPVMSNAIAARARAMLAAGGTNADVAAALGIPVSTLRSAALRGDV